MTYTRHHWTNGPATTSRLSAPFFNNIEDGVEEATDAVRGRLSEANLEGTIGSVTTNPSGSVVAFNDARYGRRNDSTTIFLGDSLEAATAGYAHRLPIVTNQRVRYLRNAGIGGNTTTQMLARIQADVIAYAPGVCVIGGPTNDHSQGIAEATTRANIAAMVAALRAANIEPVLRNCFPCNVAGTSSPWNTVASRRAVIQRHNAWISDYARDEGIPLLDVYTPLVDPATGGLRTAIAGDGTHPTEEGHQNVVDYLIAQGLPDVWTGAPQLARSIGQDDNLIGLAATSNGVFVGDTDANGLSDGWNASPSLTGVTPSLVAGVLPVVGNWQKLVFSGAAAVNLFQDTGTGRIVVGRRYEMLVRIKLTSTSGAGLRVRAANWGGTTDIGPFAYPIEGTARIEFVATTATARIFIGASSATVADMQFAQAIIREIPL